MEFFGGKSALHPYHSVGQEVAMLRKPSLKLHFSCHFRMSLEKLKYLSADNKL